MNTLFELVELAKKHTKHIEDCDVDELCPFCVVEMRDPAIAEKWAYAVMAK